MAGTAKGARKALKTRMQKRVDEVEMRLAMQEANEGGKGKGFISGVKLSLQTLDEEYVPELKQLIPRLDIFQRMGNDAKIAAQLRGNILPLLSTKRAKVMGGSQEMRDLVDQNLLRRGDARLWCETSWMQRQLEKLQCLHDGFALHAKTREIVDGYMIFRRLTYLHPRSLGGSLGPWEWDNGTGRLVAIHRQYMLPGGGQVSDERIPIEDISASVWWQTGENWEGTSLMRPMYGAWKKKDLASKIGMIALMNGGVGIPMATMGPGDGVKDRDALKTIAADLRGGSKERQFIVLATGQKIELMTSSGQIVDARPMVQEQNMDIAAAGSMDFMQQGQSESGSRAGGSVMMVAFMQQLDALREWNQEQINHGAGYLKGDVEELIYSNFEAEEVQKSGCPYIEISRVSPTEQLDNGPNISDSVQKGSITLDLKVENHMRHAYGIPELTQAEFDALQDKKAEAARQPGDLGGRPQEVGDFDREDPRDDKLGRQFGLAAATAQKKTPDATRTTRRGAYSLWQGSIPN